MLQVSAAPVITGFPWEKRRLRSTGPSASTGSFQNKSTNVTSRCCGGGGCVWVSFQICCRSIYCLLSCSGVQVKANIRTVHECTLISHYITNTSAIKQPWPSRYGLILDWIEIWGIQRPKSTRCSCRSNCSWTVVCFAAGSIVLLQQCSVSKSHPHEWQGTEVSKHNVARSSTQPPSACLLLLNAFTHNGW